MTAVPPGSSPRKISALASAIASTLLKYSRCTGSTVVTMAMCGRTSFVSGVISPAWFMPISNTPKRPPAGIRASVSGTPQWLLNDFSAACVGPMRQAAAQRVLGAGLADASGHGDDLARRARAAARDRLERAQGILDAQERAVGRLRA